ncbi:bifunctional DNA primase/polymerase [Geodermatophilus sp. SYSU D01105]
MTADHRRHALALARNGWEVLPLRGKEPLLRGGRGHLDATSDTQTVDRWWTEHPGANIGGRVPETAVVVDVDPRAGGAERMNELVRRHGRLPATLTIVSGRGDGGRHYHFRRPPGVLSSIRLGPGIDLKTHTGYVVLPPSIHPDTGRPYVLQDGPKHPQAMPRWLADLLAPAVLPVVSRAIPPGVTSSVDRLVGWVSRLERGGRNDGLFWAANRALDRGATVADLDQLVAAAIAAGLSEVEARRTVASARRRTGVAA